MSLTFLSGKEYIDGLVQDWSISSVLAILYLTIDIYWNMYLLCFEEEDLNK